MTKDYYIKTDDNLVFNTRNLDVRYATLDSLEIFLEKLREEIDTKYVSKKEFNTYKEEMTNYTKEESKEKPYLTLGHIIL